MTALPGSARGPVLLASRSPRRADLLAAAGIPYELLDVGPVDESPPTGPDGRSLPLAAVVEALARRKAEAGAAHARSRLVLAADTLVVLGPDEVLGKPADPAAARAMLARLSGRAHTVATGVALLGPDGDGGIRLVAGSRSTRVRFRTLPASEIQAYVDTGEPLDKAGAYALQGGAASFVTVLEGDADTVIGLPIGLVREFMALWGDRPGDPAIRPDGR